MELPLLQLVQKIYPNHHLANLPRAPDEEASVVLPAVPIDARRCILCSCISSIY